MRIGATLLTTARGRDVGSVTSVLTPGSLSLAGESINEPPSDMLRVVERLAALGSRMTRALHPVTVGAAERARVAANLRMSLLAGLAGSFLGAVATFLGGELKDALALVVLCVTCILALWLVRRGRVRTAGLVLLSAMLATVHGLLLLGEGVHDRATLLYPVIILVAALQLDRRLLVATTGLCVLSAMIVTRLEMIGALQTPWAGRLGWLPLVDTTIVLVVTAVAVHLLVADVVRGTAETRAQGERLAKANRELEASSAELERFTYVVSHDLKSPLVTIRGFLSYVERDARGGDLDRLESDLGRIRAATDRMGRLLEDLLELSRTGRIDRPPEDVPFEDVVREARALVFGRLSAGGVRVEVDEPLPVVRGDRQRLVELVQNLLENTAKFMGDQKDPEVRIGARGEGAGPGHVTLFVRDNGIGIDPAHQGRVFELFHRLDPSVEGTGLGLALARRIVETHGGRIWLESAGVGHGSTFCFSLPVAGSAPEPGRSPRGQAGV
jgi:signal transduction histidine kinase